MVLGYEVEVDSATAIKRRLFTDVPSDFFLQGKADDGNLHDRFTNQDYATPLPGQTLY